MELPLIQLKNYKYINNKSEDITIEESNKIQLIGFYFTGSWCLPCLEFEKQLVNFYTEINYKEKIFEIIQVSFEKDEESFKNYIKDTPWVFLQYNDPKVSELGQFFSIKHVPSMIISTRDGVILSDEGRNDIASSEPSSKAVEKWIKQLKLQKERDRLA